MGNVSSKIKNSLPLNLQPGNPVNLKSQFQQAMILKDRQTAQITDKGSYIVVRTSDRPDYFWGNYIIMSSAPAPDSYSHWLTIFESEIGPKSQTGFVAITWDFPGDQGQCVQFTDKGFSLQTSIILSASRVHAPPKSNPHVTIKPLQAESDFAQTIDVHFTPDWQYCSDEGQIKFLKGSAKRFRKLIDAGTAISIGAFQGDKLTAVVEMYYNDNLCILDSVVTHRDHRRQGICLQPRPLCLTIYSNATKLPDPDPRSRRRIPRRKDLRINRIPPHRKNIPPGVVQQIKILGMVH